MEHQMKCLALEKKHVYDVYDSTAHHFKDIRYKAWPKVRAFLANLEPASLVIDVGCGSGKYLHINKEVFKLGCDRSPALTNIARSRHHEVVTCDNLHLPYRDNAFDAVISIGVIHHFTTKERRAKALQELARILRPGGKIMIYVWAMEQNHRKFEAQDVLVPWHLQHNLKQKRKSDSSRSNQNFKDTVDQPMEAACSEDQNTHPVDKLTPINRCRGLYHHSLGDGVSQCQDRRRIYHRQRQAAIHGSSTSSCSSPITSIDKTKDDTEPKQQQEAKQQQNGKQHQEGIQNSLRGLVALFFNKPFISTKENKPAKTISKLDEASFKERIAQIHKEDLERFQRHRPLLEHSKSAPESELFAVREFPQSSQPLKLRKIQSLGSKGDTETKDSLNNFRDTYNPIQIEECSYQVDKSHPPEKIVEQNNEKSILCTFDKFSQTLATTKVSKESHKKRHRHEQFASHVDMNASCQNQITMSKSLELKGVFQKSHTIGYSHQKENEEKSLDLKVRRTVSEGSETEFFSYDLSNASKLFKKMKHKENLEEIKSQRDNLKIKRIEIPPHEACISSSVSLSGDECQLKDERENKNGMDSIVSSAVIGDTPDIECPDESSFSSPDDITPPTLGGSTAITGILKEVEGLQYPCLSDSDADEWAKVTVKAIRTMKTEVLKRVGSSMDSISSRQAIVGSSLELEDVEGDEESVSNVRWVSSCRGTAVKQRKTPGGSETSSISSEPYTESDYEEGDSLAESPLFTSPSPREMKHFDFLLPIERQQAANLHRNEGRNIPRRKMFQRFVSMNETQLQNSNEPSPPLTPDETSPRHLIHHRPYHRAGKKKFCSPASMPASPMQDVPKMNPFDRDSTFCISEIDQTSNEEKQPKSPFHSAKKCLKEPVVVNNEPSNVTLEKETSQELSKHKLQDNLTEGDGKDSTYQRYYHVFRQGELVTLIENQVEHLHILESYYDNANWCVVAEKVQVWKI